MNPQQKQLVNEKIQELRDLANEFDDILGELVNEGVTLAGDFLNHNPAQQFLDELESEVENLSYIYKKRELESKVSTYPATPLTYFIKD